MRGQKGDWGFRKAAATLCVPCIPVLEVSRVRDALGFCETHPDTNVDGDVANDRKHADAPMLDLRLAHPVQREVAAQAERVEANITGHGAVQTGRLLEEWEGLRLGHHRDGRALRRERSRQGGREGERRGGERQHSWSAGLCSNLVCSLPPRWAAAKTIKGGEDDLTVDER
eukprot:scaffold275021_cov27-Tisochrysis_lutea.AAC.3